MITHVTKCTHVIKKKKIFNTKLEKIFEYDIIDVTKN